MMRASRLYPWTLALAVVLFGLTLALPLWRVVPLSAQWQFIPLHYNVIVGVDQFGPWQQIFVMPALGLFILIFNLLVQTLVFGYDKLLASFFAIGTVVAELGLLVAMALVVLLNL